MLVLIIQVHQERERYYVVGDEQNFVEIAIPLGNGTNNKSETYAVGAVLKSIREFKFFNDFLEEKDIKINKIIIVSDSTCAINRCRNKKIPEIDATLINWVKKQVTKTEKEKNVKITWYWTGGHSDDEMNDKADKLAVIGREASKHGLKEQLNIHPVFTIKNNVMIRWNIDGLEGVSNDHILKPELMESDLSKSLKLKDDKKDKEKTDEVLKKKKQQIQERERTKRLETKKMMILNAVDFDREVVDCMKCKEKNFLEDVGFTANLLNNYYKEWYCESCDIPALFGCNVDSCKSNGIKLTCNQFVHHQYQNIDDTTHDTKTFLIAFNMVQCRGCQRIESKLSKHKLCKDCEHINGDDHDHKKRKKKKDKNQKKKKNEDELDHKNRNQQQNNNTIKNDEKQHEVKEIQRDKEKDEIPTKGCSYRNIGTSERCMVCFIDPNDPILSNKNNQQRQANKTRGNKQWKRKKGTNSNNKSNREDNYDQHRQSSH